MALPFPEQGIPERRRQEHRRRRDPLRPRLLPKAKPAHPIVVAHPVIVGYHGSASARRALVYAAGVARRLSRPLLIVYVTSPGLYCALMAGQVAGSLRDGGPLERWLLTEFDQTVDSSGINVHVRTRLGSPARELSAIAAEFGADALVLGAPKHFWHHVLGSVPAWLTRHAPCPVIIVP